MDSQLERLRAEFLESSRRTAELRVQLDRAEGRIPSDEIPHYMLIENSTHQAGQLVSRIAQQIHMNELAAQHMGTAKCPECGTLCELDIDQREVLSGDGLVELQELKGHCPFCRKAFFPDAGSVRI